MRPKPFTLLGRTWLAMRAVGKVREKLLRVPGVAVIDRLVIWPATPRGWAKRMQDRCKRGHALDDKKNLVRRKDSRRQCKRCHRNAMREARATAKKGER